MNERKQMYRLRYKANLKHFSLVENVEVVIKKKDKNWDTRFDADMRCTWNIWETTYVSHF